MRTFTTVLLPLLAVCLLVSCNQPPKEGPEMPGDGQHLIPPPPPPVRVPEPVFHPSHEPKKQDSPFSDVVQVGRTYYLSGQIGMDHSVRTLVEGGIEAETHQVFKNIEAVLAQHDLQLSDVVKALVILDDIEDFAAFNGVYTQYLPQKPARTTFAAEALAAGAKIEIEVVAVRGGDLH